LIVLDEKINLLKTIEFESKTHLNQLNYLRKEVNFFGWKAGTSKGYWMRNNFEIVEINLDTLIVTRKLTHILEIRIVNL